MTRAWVEVTFGNTTAAEPMLGTFVASKNGKDNPPLVESRMFTPIALIGEPAVPATVQVTVRAPDHWTVVFGEVTANGPAVLTDVTVI